jgi:hypothetical protein
MSETPGPTPDWDRVTGYWHGEYLDGTNPTGTLEISVLWDRAIDEDTVDPIVIIGSKPIVIDIEETGDTQFALPATDDPDISRTGFTYHCKENLDQGGGGEFDFTMPLSSMLNTPPGQFLSRSFDGTEPDPGDPISAVTRAEFDELASRVGSRVVCVPTGTTGWSVLPDGTLWVEYTP